MAQSGASSGRDGSRGPVIARAHHGSVSKEQRAQIENDLKTGRLPCVVATSSLELGIDMGAVDVVVQVEAPPSVASGLQRVGPGRPSRGRDISRGVLSQPPRGSDRVGGRRGTDAARRDRGSRRAAQSLGRAGPADRGHRLGRGRQGGGVVRLGAQGRAASGSCRTAPSRRCSTC